MWGEKTGSEFSLPSSALPGSTRAAAEPSKGPAASGFASAWATQGGGRGGGGSLASPHLLCRFFSSTSCSLSVGRGGEWAPRAEQSCTDVKKEVFWLPLLSRGTGTSAASVTAAALGMVDGLRLCCRVGHGTGPCSNLGTVVVPVLGFPKPIKEGKEESKQSFVLAELSLDTAPSNSRSTELRMSNLKRH